MNEKNTFKKAEKLHRKKIIDQLFSRNQENLSLKNFPFLFIWTYEMLPTNFPAQILFVVSKKKIRKAVVRNRIRRRMRELYRLKKQDFYSILQKKDKQAAIALIFADNKEWHFEDLKEKFDGLFKKFEEITR